MTASPGTFDDGAYTGALPAFYDRYLGPALFIDFAEDMARRVKTISAGRVLEIAAGTGIVTQALVRALPSSVAIDATDLNTAMIDHARTKGAAPNLRYGQADAQALPFPDESFDAIICQFGVMFFPDQELAFRDARRVLKQGAPYIFSVWDRVEENDMAFVVHERVRRAFPDDSPNFLTRAPYGHYDLAPFQTKLRAAGFAKVTCETMAKHARSQSYADPAIGFCKGTPLRMEIEARAADRLDDVTDSAAEAIKARFGDGPVVGKIQAHVVVAST